MSDLGKHLVFWCQCGTGLRQRLDLAKPMRDNCANCGADLRDISPVVVDSMLDTLEILADAGHDDAQRQLKARKEIP